MEIATAYVSLVAETSRIAPEVKRALTGVDAQATAAGKSMGGKMSSALGTALKAGAATAGAAAVAGIGVAMTKGFQRLQAIDDAKGKLEGLGHTAQSQTKIMDSALASVKGTAYGLGDAATIAASAVAAGIKPGQQLTQYLSSIGDAAAIAGTSLGEMGLIFNQVQTGGRAMTDDLNQMAQRGIPIFQWLGEEMGVAASEVKDLASKGKVSSEVFFKAVEKNIGGAAQAAGKTVRGSFQNMVAAIGRLGAAAQQPFFARLPGAFTSATGAIDALTPKITELAMSLDHKIFEEWGPKIQAALDSVRDSGAVSDLTSTMRGLWEAAEGLVAPLGRVFTELGRASAAVGIGTWQLFLAALNAAAGALKIIEPGLSAVASLMEKNRGAVTALMAAWVAFKTVPGILSTISGPLSTLTGKIGGAQTALRGFGDQMAMQQRLAQMSGAEIGRVGSAMAVLGTHSPALSRMQTAFYGATRGVETFGNGARVAAAAGAGLKSAGSAIANVFGGPLNMALIAGTGAVMAFVSSAQRQSAQAAATAKSVRELAAAQQEMGEALTKTRGEMDESTWALAATQVEKYRESVANAAQEDGKWHHVLGDTITRVATLGTVQQDAAGELDRMAGAAQNQQAAVDSLGLSNEELTKRLYGTRAEYGTLIYNLRQTGEGGRQAAAELMKLRAEYDAQVAVARRVTPGVGELAEAARVLGDEGASAADKLKALRAAVDALSPARGQAEAMRQYGDAVRAVATAAEGISPAAFKADGSLDAAGESGGKLADTLGNLIDKSLQVASVGGDMARVTADNERAFQQLAAATNQPIEKIRELYGELGGSVVDVAIEVQGSNEVQAELTALRKGMDAVPEGKRLEIETGKLTEGALQTLDKLKVKYDKTPDGKTIQIDVNDQTKSVLDLVTKKTDEVGAKKVSPTVDLNSIPFDAKDKTVRAQLEALQASKVAPEADLVIQKLLDGKNISASELAILDAVVAKPSADMDTAAILAKIMQVKLELDAAAKPRTTFIDVITRGANVNDAVQSGNPFLSGNANGSIVAYANGGIAAAEAFANGGYKHIDKPRNADIFAGRGAGTIFAEEETGGEAYIPLAPSKRSRSTDILATVAKMFGMSLVPADSVSGLLGGIAGGAVSKLLQAAGADRIKRFADGGFNATQLRELVDGGHGASGPLTGSPYVLGGVNWGDCSGAMSAPTRAAAGLDPFGGRWSTGSAAGDLAAMGYSQGRGGPGDMRVGFYNGGEGGGHTAGTLPDGTNIEMGGQNGGGMVGGSVGSDHSQFTDHFFLRVADGVSGAITDALDPFEYVDPTTTPDSPGSPSESGGDSISSRFGNAASAAVSGQIQDILGVFGISDSPGALKAWNQFEQTRNSGSPEDKAKADDQAKRAFEDESVRRKRAHEDELAALKSDLAGKRIDQAEHDRRSLELKRKFEDAERERKRAFEDGKTQGQSRRDPGTHKPKKDEDLGTGKFDQGGVAYGKGLLRKDIIAPERVLSPRQNVAFEEMVKREFKSGVGTDQVLAKLDAILRTLIANGTPEKVTLRDENEYYERKARRDRAVIAAGSGGR